MDLILLIWIIIAAGFLVGEMMTLTFYMIPFSIGALVAILLYFAGAPIPAQVAVFIVVSVVCAFFIPRFARSITKGSGVQPTNSNTLIGQTAPVIEDYHEIEGYGRVMINGEPWLAVPLDKTKPFHKGDEVKITGIVGVKVIVENIKNADTQ